MGRYAPVLPIHLAEKLFEYDQELFGTYHLLLAHDVMESEDKKRRYEALYTYGLAEAHRIFDGVYTIMDNSICELGGAVDMQWVFEAGDIADANVIVIPDAMGDGDKTIRLLHETIQKYS